MNKRQIVNIVNFIRDVEPRGPVDLVEPVREQIAVMKKYGLRGTFLLQYDALIDPVYVGMLKELDPAQFELGVWFEVVEPQCRAAGIEWTGRFPWDWHVHCGFSMGYTKPQREKLCDVLFEKFRETFGYYPRVFGSWFFDTHTVRYLSDKYGLDALCNCKEQYGTDGYTLWGGYYGQAYYPSRKNVFMPAQTGEGQIPVPLFRMLGSDPVYQYDFGMSAEAGASRVQGVITLEPVYNGGGGGIPAWDDPGKNSVWYCTKNYRINLYAADGSFRIRDLHIFDERTPDPFEDTVCPANEAVYETLPVIDGNRHTGRGVIAGAVLIREGKPVRAGEMTFEDLGGGEAKIGYGAFSILLREDGFRVESDGDFRLEYRIGRYDDHMPAVVSCKRDELVLRYMETEYGLALKSGSFDGPTAVRSENGAAEFAIIRK